MKPIAVVIPTRNRGANAVDAAQSILRDPGDFELVVVDQSDDDTTETALLTLAGDLRLRVVRSRRVGVSEARNVGALVTTAPIIAFTDDDCLAEPGWVSNLVSAFAAAPETALVFGRVYLPKGTHLSGFAAEFEPRVRVMDGAVPTPEAGIGIGANFAIRREVLQRLGGFDPLLGAGAPYFRAGEEVDVLVRALHDGYKVVNVSEAAVLHLGIRTGRDIRPLAIKYQIATGAALGKHARLNGWPGARDAVRWTGYYVTEALGKLVRQRHIRPGVPCYFVIGVLMTFRYGISRSARTLTRRQGLTGLIRSALGTRANRS